MLGLTHQQAKRLINTAADRFLNTKDQAALDTHLAQCANCRAYANEVEWLNGAIGRALRTKWSAPRRSPIDMAARVRQRMRMQSERQMFFQMANFTVKLGSLALVAFLAIGVLRSQQVSSHPSVNSANPTTSLRNGLPSFEMESDGTSTLNIDSSVSGADKWVLPALPLNRLHATQY